jgi:hypothetical protein
MPCYGFCGKCGKFREWKEVHGDNSKYFVCCDELPDSKTVQHAPVKKKSHKSPTPGHPKWTKRIPDDLGRNPTIEYVTCELCKYPRLGKKCCVIRNHQLQNVPSGAKFCEKWPRCTFCSVARCPFADPLHITFHKCPTCTDTKSVRDREYKSHQNRAHKSK